jgi:hypothetical protein
MTNVERVALHRRRKGQRAATVIVSDQEIELPAGAGLELDARLKAAGAKYYERTNRRNDCQTVV